MSLGGHQNMLCRMVVTMSTAAGPSSCSDEILFTFKHLYCLNLSYSSFVSRDFEVGSK